MNSSLIGLSDCGERSEGLNYEKLKKYKILTLTH